MNVASAIVVAFAACGIAIALNMAGLLGGLWLAMKWDARMIARDVRRVVQEVNHADNG